METQKDHFGTSVHFYLYLYKLHCLFIFIIWGTKNVDIENDWAFAL